MEYFFLKSVKKQTHDEIIMHKIWRMLGGITSDQPNFRWRWWSYVWETAARCMSAMRQGQSQMFWKLVAVA